MALIPNPRSVLPGRSIFSKGGDQAHFGNQSKNPQKRLILKVLVPLYLQRIILKKLYNNTMKAGISDNGIKSVSYQPRWQWITLLIILGYEAAGALAGGILLVAAPDGRLMDMQVNIMHGIFPDFFIPGLILLGLGMLNVAAFITGIRRAGSGWILAGLAMGGLLFWFITEIAVLQLLHWLHIMWGLPVVAGFILAILFFPFPDAKMRKILLICGILSSIVYLALNIIVPMFWKEYDSVSQTVSELSAIGAPTRLLWLVLCIPYTILVTLFGWGVWKSAGTNRALTTAGILLVIYGSLGIVWPLVPMHLRETLAAGGSTLSDTMHIALGAITELLFLLALGFAAAGLGGKFRIYSIITVVILLVFGVLTFLDAPGVGTNQPTPFLGVWERINIGVFLIWVVVLALNLLKAEKVNSKE
jgi:hypothetical protein